MEKLRQEVMQALQRERIIPLALRRCPVRSALWHPRYSGQIIHQLATLLQAGLPLAEGLELLAQQQTGAQVAGAAANPGSGSRARASRFPARWKDGRRRFLRSIWR
ncbi:type IV pilin biogenesis protein [Raoultella terrigena]|uniref:Type IV pilin biogenesis protein n=1 Tax=Raoultella terrigena TaxID=577 RepID=A0A4U9D8Q9_RAOTE|nr:type IV pilin biogenesis protein [Raoultella terrigena]